MEREEREEESSGIPLIRIEVESKTRLCHSACGIISVERRGCLQVARSFGSKTRRLFDDVVPRGEPGPRDERERKPRRERARQGLRRERER